MEKKKKGTLLLDVSDPRAVNENVSKLPSLKLIFRDQVAEIAEEIEKVRKGKIPTVEKMVEKEIPIIVETMNTV